MHPDHLGGTRVITDQNGAKIETLYYKAFGEIRLNDKAGKFEEKRKYTGHLHDDETGLEYMLARYYDSKWGRFLSQDPLFIQLGSSPDLSKLLADPQSLNSYAYARNNPLKYVDPSGKNASSILQWSWGMAVVVSQLDSPLPGPADGAGLAIGVAGTAAAVVVGAYESIANAPQNNNNGVIIDPMTSGSAFGPYTTPGTQRGSENNLNVLPDTLDNSGFFPTTTPASQRDAKDAVMLSNDNFRDKIRDISNNPNNWEKKEIKLDARQPKNGISARETWVNKLTKDVIEKHILERNGKPAENHPHYKPSKNSDK